MPSPEFSSPEKQDHLNREFWQQLEVLLATMLARRSELAAVNLTAPYANLLRGIKVLHAELADNIKKFEEIDSNKVDESVDVPYKRLLLVEIAVLKRKLKIAESIVKRVNAVNSELAAIQGAIESLLDL